MGQNESRSGLGSTLVYSELFSDNLIRIISKYKIEAIYDCACGDWNWMKRISHHFKNYIGNDIVQEICDTNNALFGNDKIKFTAGDMVAQMKLYPDKHFDLVVCRHVLEHLPTSYVLSALQEIRRIAKYAIITSSKAYDAGRTNAQIDFDGYNSRPINLEKPPFVELLPSPTECFPDTRKELMAEPGMGNFYCFS
jgi:hypothetical protein